MPSDKDNLLTAKTTGLFFHYSTLLQPERCLVVYCSTYNAFFSELYTSVLLCVPFIFADSERCRFGSTCGGFLCLTEIVYIFHSDYFYYRGAFRKMCNRLNLADNEMLFRCH